MKKKIILIASLIATAVLLTSIWMTSVQSETTNLQIPTEWYQTSGSMFVTEQWSWDWTNYETSGPWVTGPPHGLYKRVGDAIFFAYPGGSTIVAGRIGQTNTWVWQGGWTGKGGPGGTTVMMSTGTMTFTFTLEDIPETDEDNNYKGLRMVLDTTGDLYRQVNVGGDNYVWQGWVHQHFRGWAPKGTRA